MKKWNVRNVIGTILSTLLLTHSKTYYGLEQKDLEKILNFISDILSYFISRFNMEEWEKEWLKDLIGFRIIQLEDIKDFILSVFT